MWEDTEAEDIKFCLELLKNDALLAEEDVLDQMEAYAGENGVPENCMGDSSWENIDPTPDIHAIFLELNRCYFANTLEPCTVSWSTRMTSCAGVCRFEGYGGLCSISLSERLLKFRPRKDLLETLLHEMIHAYLFLTSADRDRDAHGPHFVEHMNRINAKSGLNITIYHEFHDEVDFYKKHIWQCNGPCANHSPRFGIIRRSTNRDPNKDNAKGTWAAKHKQFCGGTYVKIAQHTKKVVNEPGLESDFRSSKIGIQRYFKPIDVAGRGVDQPNTEGGPSTSIGEPLPIKPEPQSCTNGNSNVVEVPTQEPAPKRQKMTWSSEEINKWLMAGLEVPEPTNGYIDDDLDVRRIQPDPNDLACKATHDLIVQLGYKLDAEGNIVDRLQNTNPTPSHSHPILHTSPTNQSISLTTRTPHRATFSDTVFGLKKVACPICDQLVVETRINLHLDECMTSYGQTNQKIFVTDVHRGAGPEADEVAVCPICDSFINKSILEHHAAKCATDRFG